MQFLHIETALTWFYIKAVKKILSAQKQYVEKQLRIDPTQDPLTLLEFIQNEQRNAVSRYKIKGVPYVGTGSKYLTVYVFSYSDILNGKTTSNPITSFENLDMEIREKVIELSRDFKVQAEFNKNTAPSANVSDSTACLYDAGCYGGPGVPYWLNDGCYAWVIDVDDYCCTTDWDSNCQSMYDYCQNGWPTSIEESGSGTILVYPNPTSNILNIDTRLDVDVEVYDMLGKQVINESNSKRIDFTSVPNGIYNLVILHKDIRITKRVIKQ